MLDGVWGLKTNQANGSILFPISPRSLVCKHNSKIFNFFIIFFGLFGCSQERQPGVYFKNVKDGDVLSSPINLEFGVEGFELAPSGSVGERVGHHHLLVNRDSIMEVWSFQATLTIFILVMMKQEER